MAGTSVAAVHSPEHEVALVWIQLQQQHHSLTTQLVNLTESSQRGSMVYYTGLSLVQASMP